MALMDEFKEERENIKNGTPKQKAAYFWEYYKWYVIIPVIILIVVISYIHHMVTKTDDVLNGLLINTHNVEAQTLADQLGADFCKEMKIDTKEYGVTLNPSLNYITNNTSGASNYETLQALMAWVGAGSIDFINSDVDTMTELAYREYFSDLRDILSEDDLTQYEPYFLYIDQAVIDARNKAFEDDQDASDIVLPDCRKPETMEKPVPVLIDMSECEALSDIYPNVDALAFGITSNAPNLDMTLNFLKYLMK